MSSRAALAAAFLLLLVARVAAAAEMLGTPLNGWATVVAPKTGVRLRAAADAPVLSVARKGDEVVLDEPFLFGDRWIRVRMSDGRVGWIAREHLKPGRARAQDPEPAGNARALLADESEEAAVPEGEPELPVIREPLPALQTRVSIEYGAAYARNLHAREGEDPYVWGVRRGAGIRATVLVWDPLVVDGALFGCRDFRDRPAPPAPLPDEKPEPRLERVDRGELSVGWRDTFGGADQLTLTLLAGVKRDTMLVAVEDAGFPKAVLHDATLSGFRLEYGFFGNRVLAEGEVRHLIGRQSKGWTWGGALRGRHRTGFEVGATYRGASYWAEEKNGTTYADRHMVSLALGKAF